jgi:pimeloyl-ACP methyl ester carboxylesterase
VWADVVGWSNGGILGIDLGLRHKDRVGKVFAFAANSVTSGVVEDVWKNPTFAPYIDRAGHEYTELSATPKEYDAFVDQISKMWADQPNSTDDQLKAIDTPILVVDGDHEEAIKRPHTEYIAATIPLPACLSCRTSATSPFCRTRISSTSPSCISSATNRAGLPRLLPAGIT